MTFPFPFTPYSIQQKFMKELYNEVENGKYGIFESPTGTGKSLSICCGILKWLNDFSASVINNLENEISQIKTEVEASSDSSDWIEAEYEKIKKSQTLSALTKKLERLQSQYEKYKAMKLRVKQMKQNVDNKSKTVELYIPKGKRKENNVALLEKEEVTKETNADDQDEDFLVADEPVVDDDEKETEDESEVNEDNVKIFISSRTHSQLSQFIGEIKRTIYKDNTRVVTLASRQHFCINPDVAKLKHINLINERCLDLQKSSKTSSLGEEGKILKKSKTKSCSGCQFYNQSNITRLKENLLVDILDMEDLVKCAKELKACPYYATRMALEDAQVVLLSHAGVVSAGARSGVSLNLQNNVLILDEAHGLTAALENAHSAPVSGKQLASVKTYLQFYIDEYRARLSSKNLLSLNQLSFVVGRFMNFINPKEKTKPEESSTIFTLEDFVIKSGIDHLNLRPLVDFCRNTRLPAKLHGFSMKYDQNFLEEEMKNRVKKKSSFEMFLSSIAKNKVEEKVEEKTVGKSVDNINQTPSSPSAGSALYALLDFLQRLCDRGEDGRVLAQMARDDTGLLKYLLLNPAQHFGDVVKQCRSVILAGGTMEPISEFQSLLSNQNAIPVDDIAVVRCDHVVPPDNVLAICLSRGPTNVALNLSYENRQSKHLLEEIGRILRNVCSLVPGGVVCFFPSYSYEQSVHDHLTSTGVMDSLKKKKMVFREPKSAADVDQVLSKFAKAVRSKEGGTNGALLLSVVGGKLSEGLNFSDELGRCVIVVGMPYPNIKSPELQEKMNYLNKTLGAGAGSVYYENLCMKAVNQCIGRAVRHANDYACVLLLDERYSRPQTVSALPSFVQKSLKANSNFGPTIGSIAKFFNSHKYKEKK